MGGVSSEAAQKAFPDIERGDDERYDDFEVRETIMAYSRDAFDRGAVEALKQAAAQVDTGSAEWVRLMNMAGFWKTGQ